MKKITYVVAVISILSLVLLGSSSFAQTLLHPDSQVLGEPVSMCVLYQTTSWDLFEASWLVGHEVMSPEGLPFGQISNLMIDRSNGRIALVVLSDVPGFGAKSVTIPFGSLIRTGQDAFQISFPYTAVSYYETAEYDREMGMGVVPSTIDSNWVASVYRNYGLTPYWEEKGAQPLMELYKSNILIGAEVRPLEGEERARVDDLVINSDGSIVFLSLRNVAGRGDSLVAVPFSTLSRSEENTFALNIAGEKLAAAPIFNEREDISNREYAAGVYRFFGVQPCWIEEGSSEPK